MKTNDVLKERKYQTGPKKPWKFNDDCVQKLVDGLKVNMSVVEACNYAGISTSSYYERYNVDSEFMDKIEGAKCHFNQILLRNISIALNSDDLSVKEKAEFSLKIAEKTMPERFGKVSVSEIKPIPNQSVKIYIPSNGKEPLDY